MKTLAFGPTLLGGKSNAIQLGGWGGNPLSAPTLAYTADTNPAEFTAFITLPEVGDIIQLQVSTSSDFSTTEADQENTLDAGEVVDEEADFTVSLSGGSYYARARHKRGGLTSAWSNTVSFTLVANSVPEFVASDATYQHPFETSYSLSIDSGTAQSRDVFLFICHRDNAARKPTGIVFDSAGDNITGTQIAIEHATGIAALEVWQFEGCSNGGTRDFDITFGQGGANNGNYIFAVYEQLNGTSTVGTPQTDSSFQNDGTTLTISSAVFGADWSFVLAGAHLNAQSLAITRDDSEAEDENRQITWPSGHHLWVEIYTADGTTNLNAANSGTNGYVSLAMVPFTYD